MPSTPGGKTMVADCPIDAATPIVDIISHLCLRCSTNILPGSLACGLVLTKGDKLNFAAWPSGCVFVSARPLPTPSR